MKNVRSRGKSRKPASENKSNKKSNTMEKNTEANLTAEQTDMEAKRLNKYFDILKARKKCQECKAKSANPFGDKLGDNEYAEITIIPVSEFKFNGDYEWPLNENKKKWLFDSIRRFGFDNTKRIIVNEKMEILDGRHRVLVAREFGIKSLPAVVCTHSSKEFEMLSFILHKAWDAEFNQF
jgi:hypothetical protein